VGTGQVNIPQCILIRITGFPAEVILFSRNLGALPKNAPTGNSKYRNAKGKFE
jgi:hypothetical protein